ncbi:hypothetical protein RVS70_05305 [Virgibacillus sp. M23]|uniref:hypothetical protein n=1 Tax=Virgibacillus sp. M23 TaxID=3079030 RepID=UPI002A91EEB0|nr:hypothetical protein [Virgibacillus sp. M23]MDY7043618.1 hypothetical protein [Virgibacillus sp. M23]
MERHYEGVHYITKSDFLIDEYRRIMELTQNTDEFKSEYVRLCNYIRKGTGLDCVLFLDLIEDIAHCNHGLNIYAFPEVKADNTFYNMGIDRNGKRYAYKLEEEVVQ